MLIDSIIGSLFYGEYRLVKQVFLPVFIKVKYHIFVKLSIYPSGK
jgi:hypothetical protein